MLRYFGSFLLIILTVSLAHAGDAKVTFDSNVKVSILSKDGLANEEAVESGRDVLLKPDTVYWITSSGKVPVLVVPQNPPDAQPTTKLQLPDVANWPSEVASQQLQSKLASVIDDLYLFQTALARRDVSEAEKILNRMENVQPMDYYSFLRASLAFVKGDMKTARDQVQRGLKRYPANVQGTSLLKTIEGAGK